MGHRETRRKKFDGHVYLAFSRAKDLRGKVLPSEPLAAEEVGDCPECGKPVFELDGYFACTAALTGCCSFKLDKADVEGTNIIPGRDIMTGMLESGSFDYTHETGYEGQTREEYEEYPSREYTNKLVRSGDSGWHVEAKETVLPFQY